MCIFCWDQQSALGWMRGNEPITPVHTMLNLWVQWPRVWSQDWAEHIKWHKMAKCEKEDVQSRVCGRIAALEWLFFTCYCGLLSSDLWLVNADHLITGHTLNTSAFKVWRTEDFEEVKIIKVKQYISTYINIIMKNLFIIRVNFLNFKTNVVFCETFLIQRLFFINFFFLSKCLCKRDIRRRN